MGRLRTLLFFCGIFFSAWSVFSQQEIELKGKIIADSIAFRKVNIINLTTQSGTINTSAGNFIIKVKEGDELFFSSLQYEPEQVSVTSEMIKRGTLKIYLFPLVNELEEVKISDIDLSGKLAKDANGIETEPYVDFSKMGIGRTQPKYTTAERRVYTATGGNQMSFGLYTQVSGDLILNAINGKLAMVYRQLEYEKETQLVQKGLQSMPPSFFLKELKIPEEYLEDFMYFASTDDSYLHFVENDKLKLIDFFKEKFKDYKEFKEWEN